MNPIFVTGSSGFIGFHLASRLLREGYPVVGLDNHNDYYNPGLKKDRLRQLNSHDDFHFFEGDLANDTLIDRIFDQFAFETVYHLAAQPGVRYSLKNPDAYVNSNLVGFMNILEGCRHADISHLIFASSSSVYGLNTGQPYSVHDHTDHPITLYSATKKSNEMLAHSYAHLYEIPMTGLRFFTVYGPWGRPDMAYYKFARLINEGKPIDIYNEGDMYRDFTYIDDIVEALVRIRTVTPTTNEDWDRKNPDPASSSAPYRLYNLGNNEPVHLMKFVEILEKELGTEAEKSFKSMQPGDVYKTWADCSELYAAIDYRPQTGIRKGIKKFVAWFNEYQ